MTTKHVAACIPGIAQPLAKRGWGSYLLWVPATALLGFVISAFFSGLLHLPRSIYLIPYVGLVSLFFYAFLRWSGLSLINLLRHNWPWGLIGAVLLGMFTHIAMHIAGVLQGSASILQLPPHY